MYCNLTQQLCAAYRQTKNFNSASFSMLSENRNVYKEGKLERKLLLLGYLQQKVADILLVFSMRGDFPLL